VIEVAIVRPGPIQGDMVHPYLRRRNGEEPVDFPHEDVRRVLGKTLGVPLFQEQAMALAIVAAGFTPGQADRLRRAMAAWKRKGDQMARFETQFIDGMLSRGYRREFAERCFRQLRGFSEYGFPESHAASFALLVYVSAWLKKHCPAAFAAALLNSQPMGFYAPAQIVRDAADHGVEVRAVDVNHSAWDCTLEPGACERSPALRLGMRLVKGLRQEHAERIAAAAGEHGFFETIDALRQSSRAPVAALRRLAAADAFTSMKLSRQAALWHIRALRDEPAPMFAACSMVQSVDPPLPPMTAPRNVIHDYQSVGLSLKAHPMSFMRPALDARKVTRAGELADENRWKHGRRITVAGLVLVRQRPATASGIVFMTLEDETAIANLIIRPQIYDRFRRAARHGVVVLARGTVERQGAVVHVLTTSLQSLNDEFTDLVVASRDFH
jgi:error-prone DNA polymerase